MEHKQKKTLYLLAPLLFCATSSCSLLWRNNNNKEIEGASHADSCVTWILDRGISRAWALRSDSARFSFLSFLNVMFSLRKPYRIFSILQRFRFCTPFCIQFFILMYVMGKIMPIKVMSILSSATMNLFDATTNSFQIMLMLLIT